MEINPWKESSMTEVTATLKWSKGYEDPWLVIKGETAADVKRGIEEATGLSGDGISLVDLIHNASAHVHSVNNVGATLGGTVIREGTKPEPEPEKPQEPAPQPEPEPEQESPVLGLIADAKSQKALGDLYQEHRKAFQSTPALMAALQARAAELK